MHLIFDERETTLYDKCIELLPKFDKGIQISKKVLTLGDILLVKNSDSDNEIGPKIEYLFERKSLSDLVASIKDGRYEEQSYRLIHASNVVPSRIMYLIEGMFSQIRNPQEKKMIYSGMTSLSAFKGFQVLRTCSLTETAEFLLHFTDKIVRDQKKGKVLYSSSSTQTLNPTPILDATSGEEPKNGETQEKNEVELQENISSDLIPILIPNNPENYCTVVKKVKKENVTKENMGEILLCQIPGISAQTAMAIMAHTNHSFLQLLEVLKTDPKSLETIKINKKRISKSAIEKMIHFLLV
jgi:ERCC4-type nuclease